MHVCLNLDEKPARQLHARDAGDAGAVTDGHSVGGPRSREVQPEGMKTAAQTVCRLLFFLKENENFILVKKE